MSQPAAIDYKIHDGTLTIKLSGSFTAANIIAADKIARQLPGAKNCQIDCGGIKEIDTTGAWIITRFCTKLKSAKAKITLIHVAKHTLVILEQIAQYCEGPAPAAQVTYGKFQTWLREIGKATVQESQNALKILSFLGEITLVFLSCLRRVSKFRIPAIFVFLQRVGLNAMPIVGLISFLVGVVLIYQGSYQLRKFGAEVFAIDLLAISILREVGILITAIVMAGRCGSAFTAQIGTMKLNQEIDAMRVIGLNHIEVLVIPRMVALMIALPLLAFYTDVMGLLGGAIMAKLTMDISFEQFLSQLNLGITNWTFWVGIIKAPMFAFVIALIGCFEGLQVKESAESIGIQTTRSVVEAIFLVIIFNAAFSLIFTYVGI